MSKRSFLLSWDNTGLEGVVEVDYDQADLAEQQRLVTIMTDADAQDPGNAYVRKLDRIINSMRLRARANPQRHYEIYLVPVTDSITEDDIRLMFASTPQAAADLMRERGTQLYSDRARHDQVVIR